MVEPPSDAFSPSDMNEMLERLRRRQRREQVNRTNENVSVDAPAGEDEDDTSVDERHMEEISMVRNGRYSLYELSRSRFFFIELFSAVIHHKVRMAFTAPKLEIPFLTPLSHHILSR